MRGTNPDWANLPRRKCDDCGKSYKPKQPLREGTRGFCSDNCRKSYHKHGGAYRKLKIEMLKMVTREMGTLEKRLREIVLEELREAISGEDVAAAYVARLAVVSSPSRFANLNQTR
jgi:hypothetical protein